MELANELIRILPKLLIYAEFKTKNKHDAEDLTMEIITNMLKANKLIPDKNKNVERYAITSIKKRSENLRELQEKTTSEIDAIGRSIYDETQDENSAKFPESWDFEKILKNLDVKCQEIFTLFGLGNEYEEIADVMGLKTGTVKSRLARCRNTLSKKRKGHRYG